MLFRVKYAIVMITQAYTGHEGSRSSSLVSSLFTECELLNCSHSRPYKNEDEREDL